MRRYLQQYGKERTATNYLKALLALNFNDIVLFDNRLGSKHGPFCEVRQWMEAHDIRTRADFEDLLHSDRYWKERNIPSSSEFEWVHQPVTYAELLALRDGRLPLGYLISIKDPYACAVSINRWKQGGLKHFQTPPQDLVVNAELIRRYAVDFNSAYASYWELIANARGILVRYEDLLADAISVISGIRNRFHLATRKCGLRDIDTTVAPTYGISASPFYRSFYLKREYLASLSDECLAAIRETIDWELMGRYGYSVAGPSGTCGPDRQAGTSDQSLRNPQPA